jgi:ABC-type tungstate transport system permease subunit
MKLNAGTCATVRLVLTICLAQATAASAAEIKLLTTKSIAIVLDEIGPEFERTTGHKIVMTVDLAPVLKRGSSEEIVGGRGLGQLAK